MLNYKKILGATTAALMCASIFLGSISPAQAAVRVKNSNGTYTVRSGDSLWFIARDFSTSIQNLKNLNGLKSDSVVPGQVLRLNSTSNNSINLTRGSRGTKVSQVQSYLKSLGFYKGSIDGIYGLQTARGVVGFQRSKGIYANGKIDSNTYNALVKAYNIRKNTNTATANTFAATSTFSANRGSSQVGGAVAYDWWTSVNDELFPRHSVAKVTDVRTRKTFYIKRTYGTNHADAEALTINDTNIIKSIWGGFSWERRPVVIQINGHRIAASIAAMPHAGIDGVTDSIIVNGRSGGYGTGTNLDAVKGNGMDGVIDVHFLNSKTHGSNKVDAQHQAAVREAIGK